MNRPFVFYGMGLFVLPGLFVLLNQFQAPKTTPSVIGAVPVHTQNGHTATGGLSDVIKLATVFKSLLNKDQIATLQLAYSKTDAAKWSNFPQGATRPPRVGIKLGSLDASQLKAAKAIMAAALANGIPNEGYDELEGELAADEYFATATGNSNFFGAGNYFLAFLGEPSTTGLWELQFGGHHYAFANTYNNGKITGVTPSFRGVEPMSPVTMNGHTYQPIEQERQAFAALLGSLTSSQQATAKLSNSFRDVLLGPGRDGQFPATKQGIKVADLTATEQKLVIKAIGLYVNDLEPTVAGSVMAGYTAELADTYVAYSGSETMNQPGDYVRLDGPGIWIEYSAQPSRDFPGTTHPHSVWRDHRSDYGGN